MAKVAFPTMIVASHVATESAKILDPTEMTILSRVILEGGRAPSRSDWKFYQQGSKLPIKTVSFESIHELHEAGEGSCGICG